MANPDDATSDTSGMPIAARVHLAHAVVQHVAESVGVDLLHLKGPAFDAKSLLGLDCHIRCGL